jgi:hypothetical protein
MARFWFGLVAAFAFVASAQAQTVDRVVITDPGFYEFDVEKVDKGPDSVSTGFKTIKNVRLVQKAERIPAIVGTSFGFRFEIIGEPKNEPVTLRFVTRFPAGGLRNPQGKVLLVSENDRMHRIGENNFRTYTFDEAWEAVPGIWTLEFWYQGKLVGSQRFEVVKADALPKPEIPKSVDPSSKPDPDKALPPPVE